MNSKPGIIGRKLGMTQYFADDGNVMRVTVVEAGPVVVVAKRTQEQHGYTALVLGFEERKPKHTTKPVAGCSRRSARPRSES
jgi:large subunit ribosomal protein L3